jgi:hypothetical protein
MPSIKESAKPFFKIQINRVTQSAFFAMTNSVIVLVIIVISKNMLKENIRPSIKKDSNH